MKLLKRVKDIKTLRFLVKHALIRITDGGCVSGAAALFYSIIKNIVCPKCWVISFFLSSLLFIVCCCLFLGIYQLGAYLLSSYPFYNTILAAAPLLHCSSIKRAPPWSLITQFQFQFSSIGPINKDIIEIIFGSLLGKGHIDRKRVGTSITFYQEAMHVKYLLLLHNQLATAGYCDKSPPKVGKKLGKKGKMYKTIKFSTWNYTSLDWVFDLWYVNGIKVVPKSIGYYLTPLTLAIWVMDSSVKSLGGLNFTSCFSYSDCLLLVQGLNKNFGLEAKMRFTGMPNQYNVYIQKESMINLRNIISSFIIPQMKYKLLP